jgi:hypothetical protein
MNELLKEIWKILVAFWGTGNRWLRWAIYFFLGWFILMCFTAAIPHPGFKAIVVLLPFLTIVFGCLAFIDPLILAVIAVFPQGRKVIRLILIFIGIELVIGVYVSLVPISKDISLLPVLALTVIAILFLGLVKGKIGVRVTTILFCVVITLTIIFFLGGREKAMGRVGNLFSGGVSYSITPYPYEYKLSANQTVYTEVGVDSKTTLHYWASKPFYIVSGKKDGTIEKFWMPKGESTTVGGEVAGPAVLNGLTDGTIVKIKKIK